MTNPLLVLGHVDVGYGSIPVLHDISLEIGEGRITALIGSNGAGKTTLMRCIAGLIPQWRGTIRYKGIPFERLPASDRVMLGVSLVPEGRDIFVDFTVEENLNIGAFNPRVRRRRRQLMKRMYEQFPVLGERRHQRAGTLSGGEQQMLALGRSLMSEPRLLLLDEPSLGLAPRIVAQLFGIVTSILDHGASIFIVEQNVRKTLEIADHAYVLETGHIVVDGPGQDLLANPKIKQAYLGL